MKREGRTLWTDMVGHFMAADNGKTLAVLRARQWLTSSSAHGLPDGQATAGGRAASSHDNILAATVK